MLDTLLDRHFKDWRGGLSRTELEQLLGRPATREDLDYLINGMRTREALFHKQP